MYALSASIHRMSTERAKKRAKQDKKEGKSPSTQAGEFVREEMERYKKGTGNAQSPQQAIAIGLSEARREGVDVPDRRSPAKKKAAAKKRAPAKKATAKKKSTATKKSGAKKKRSTAATRS